MIKRLLGSVREYKKPSFLTVLFITLEAAIECIIPFITARLINALSQGQVSTKELLLYGLLLIFMAFISLCCGATAGWTSAKAAAGFSKNLRHDIFKKIQSFSFENIDGFSSSSLVTRMTTDIGYIQMAFMMMIRIAVRAPLMLIFSIVMAYVMGGQLAMSFVILIPIIVFGLAIIAKSAMPAFRAVFKKYDKLNESIEENVRGMRVVKGFSREEFEKQKFQKASDNIKDDFTKAERIVAINGPLQQFAIYFNLVFVLLVGSKLVIESGGSLLNVGEISALLTYGVQIFIQLMMLSMIYVMFTISMESMHRVSEVLETESNLKSPKEGISKINSGCISFENVSFKHSQEAENESLYDINLNIPSGATVGIIGGTGSGKSSLVQLIPRLYDVNRGSVKVDNHNVKDIDLEYLRNEVAFVLQKNLLFSGTIKENLRWGNPEATDEEIIEACKIAQAHDFITSFKDGYDTYIEQGGSNVSGGQKQRLCIARALLKDPKILILDDSTSAVDTKTDALIQRGFKETLPNTTKIIIAQRINSIEKADMIVVMENGTISDIGTHDELYERNTIYHELVHQQKGGFGK